MNRYLKLVAILIGLSIPCATHAEDTPTSPPQLAVQTETFFSLLKLNEVDKAYAAILTANLFKDKKQELENLSIQTSASLKLYGKIDGWELVAQDKKSPYYIVQIYELRMDDFIMFYHFSFYKNSESSNWKVVNISFTDSDDLSIK